MILTESLRRPGEGNRPVFRKAEFACPEFELVNKCAYFDYQRDRVFARTKRLPKKARFAAYAKDRETSLVDHGCFRDVSQLCDIRGSRKITCEKTIQRWLIDLKYYKTRIGVKKWQPRYLIRKYRCRSCGQTSLSPNRPFDAKSCSKYGHGLICWCVYHNIVGKQPMLQVHRGLRDIFGLNIPSKTDILLQIQSGISLQAPMRGKTRGYPPRQCFARRRNTREIKEDHRYVWVLSSASKVYYLFRDSREGTFLHELLGLVSRNSGLRFLYCLRFPQVSTAEVPHTSHAGHKRRSSKKPV